MQRVEDPELAGVGVGVYWTPHPRVHTEALSLIVLGEARKNAQVYIEQFCYHKHNSFRTAKVWLQADRESTFSKEEIYLFSNIYSKYEDINEDIDLSYYG